MEYLGTDYNLHNESIEGFIDNYIFNEKFEVSEKCDTDSLKYFFHFAFNNNVEFEILETKDNVHKCIFKTNNSRDLILLGFLLKDFNTQGHFVKF